MLPANQQPLQHFALLDALQHAVIATNTSGRITGWSTSAEFLYGWKSDEVIGQDILAITPSNLSRTQAAEIMETLRSGDVWSGDFRVRRRNGDDFLASVTDVPLLDDAQQLVGVVGVSALAGSRGRFSVVMRHFVGACDRLWPGRVTLEFDVPNDVVMTASDPHLLQLMALLMIRRGSAMDTGSHAQIGVHTLETTKFAEFIDIPLENALEVRFAWSDQRMIDPPLKRFVSTARLEPYAAKLVRLAKGVLLRGFDQKHWRLMHLILPKQDCAAAPDSPLPTDPL
jgi:PAS domain S-box-containing protein